MLPLLLLQPMMMLLSVVGMVTMYDWSPDRSHLHVDRGCVAGASDEVNGAAYGSADCARQGLACPGCWSLPVRGRNDGALSRWRSLRPRLLVMVGIPRSVRQSQRQQLL